MPVEGNPFKIMLPVDTVQVGWMIVPITGAMGTEAGRVITTFADASEIHPREFVTVKVYVPFGMPDIVVLMPVPVVVIPPGERVIVQVPVEGNPFNITLPVETKQVGCVVVPAIGAAGADGCVLITTFADATEVQAAIVTVKVYVPGPISETVPLVPVPVVKTPPGMRVRVQVPVAGKPFNTTLPVATAHVG